MFLDHPREQVAWTTFVQSSKGPFVHGPANERVFLDHPRERHDRVQGLAIGQVPTRFDPRTMVKVS